MNEDTVLESGGLEGFSPLDSLPSTLRYNFKDDHDSVLEAIIYDDVDFMKNQNPKSLQIWSLKVKLALTIKDIPENNEDQNTEDNAEEDEVDANARSKFRGTFNALHVATILESTKVFHYLLNNMPEEMLKQVVAINPNAPDKIDEVDVTERWVFQANCAHLAVKYMPAALQLLLATNTTAVLKEIPSKPFGTYPLHLAAMNNDALSTRILLRHRASHKVQDGIGYTPLHYASRRNNLSSLAELLDAGANPFSISNNERTPLGKANGYECAQLLLIKMREDARNTSRANLIKDALVQTAEQNQLPGATEAILDSAITCSEGEGNLFVYDMSILLVEEQASPNLQENAASQSLSDEDCNEMDVHTTLKENGNSQLLLHPLMAMFLHIKWQLQKDTISVIKEMILNLLHVFLLSALGYNFLALVSCTPIPLDEIGVKDCFTTSSGKFWCFHEENSTWEIKKASSQLNCFKGPRKLVGCMETGSMTHWKRLRDDDESCLKNFTLKECMEDKTESFEMRCHKNFIRTSKDKSAYPLLPICEALGHSNLWECWFSQGLTFCVMLTTILTLIREFRELNALIARKSIARGCYGYLKSLENRIQLFICLTSATFIGLAPFHTELATHFGAWALFAAWIDLTYYIGRFKIIGEYVYIVNNVSKILLRCLIVYVPTLIAFSFGFSMLLHANPAFESWVSSGLKVMTMMLGELEFGDHFIYHEVKEIGGRNHSVQVMFLLFVIMVAVIIMNLVVAMTISATNELRKDSEIIQIMKRVKDIKTAGNLEAAKCCCWKTPEILSKIYSKTSEILREIYSKITGFQRLPTMVKKFLNEKKTKKVMYNLQAYKTLSPYHCIIFQICLSMKRPKPSKFIWKKPLTWPFIRDAYNGWCGGEYPIFAFTFQKGRKMKMNAYEGLIKQTQEHLAKKKMKSEDLENKLRSIKEELNQKWSNLPKL